ncbi:MAG: threonylcarbamoyl-AMP synthase [Acidobacteriota bacterium]|nr:threonylcarbamoyl-AMP synthase [Acidobacteriota bacterium]
MLVRRIDPDNPDPDILAEAAGLIERGGIVACATDTLYGLLADPTNANAIVRLFDIKGRPGDRAVPLIAADAAQVAAQIGPLPGSGPQLAARWWPGPLSLLVPAGPFVVPGVHGGTGRVAVRVPAQAVARGLCRMVGRPLTATSANRSGEPPAATAAEVRAQLDESLSLLLDAGPAPGGPPSTIVDVTGRAPTLVRAGAIPWEHVLRSLEEGAR